MNREETYFLSFLEAEGSGSTSFSNRYMFWMRRRRTEQAVARALKERGLRRASLLDIGCGNGSLALYLLDTVGDKCALEITGVDISEMDVELARRKAAFFEVSRCRFEVADGCRLPFPDASFDVVTALEIIEHVARPPELLREIYRVLKPGGAAVLTTPNGGPRLPVAAFRALNALSGGWLRRTFALDKRTGSEEKDRRVMKITDPHEENTRRKHISVKGAAAWHRLVSGEGFRVRAIRGTGGVIWGGAPLDRHRVLFALSVLLDAFLDLFWCSYLWSETLVIDLRKGRAGTREKGAGS
ncbi:MAG: class I SAM-dependent methyltransferase [Deltaproteobacteria bacterium]